MASPCQVSTSYLQLFGLRTLIFQSVKVYLTLQLIVLCFVYISNAAVCKKTGVCSCETSGMKIDLSPLSDVPGGSYSSPGKTGKEIFFYNPCKEFSKKAACQNALLCQENDKLFYLLGESSAVNFSGSPEDKNLTINYTASSKGVPAEIRYSRVALICSQSKPHFKFLDESPQRHYAFEFYTDLVCLRGQVNRLSTGSVLVILFFVFVVIYLVGGVLFLRIARGAQGTEMIPNRQFWLELPLLVKEGVYFVCRGCKTDTTYQQI